MKKSKTVNYGKKFVRLAIASLPHRLLSQIPNRRVQNALKTVARGTSFTTRIYSDSEVDRYMRSVKNVKLWHGTGRYQYDQEGKIVDVLEGLVSSGGLVPRHDVYTILLGMDEVRTVSTTRLRIIARCYADTHGKGRYENDRFGDSLWWAAYYYGLFYARVYLLHGRTLRRNWKKWKQAATLDGKTIKWGCKVNKNAKSVWDTFGLGSDIKGNYPIILGIETHLAPIAASNLANSIEVRFDKVLSLEGVCHIEVPDQKVELTRELLAKAGYEIPVLPIELGEFVASKQSLKDLITE